MPRSRYHVVHEQCPHFLTVTVNRWLPLFTRPAAVDIVLESWRYLQREAEFVLYGYVILENHLHLIAKSNHLSNDMQRFKSFTAKQILALLQRHGDATLLALLEYGKRDHKTECRYQVWEEGSHPQIIESDAVMRQKLDYIHQNPVRRGYVDRPEHWRYSSARNYAGVDALIEVTTAW